MPGLRRTNKAGFRYVLDLQRNVTSEETLGEGLFFMLFPDSGLVACMRRPKSEPPRHLNIEHAC